MKRFCSFIISFLLVAVPFFGQLYFNVYAEVNVPNPTVPVDIDHNDLTAAFLAYCKARDITIDGGIANAVTSFTSGGFHSACKLLGIDAYQLQSEIKKVVDPDSNRLKYFVFTQLGITGFNRVCAQFLTDYELAAGDENVDKVVYSGEWFEDSSGHGCFVFQMNSTESVLRISNISQYGTYYYDWNYFYDNLSSLPFGTSLNLSVPYNNNVFNLSYNLYGSNYISLHSDTSLNYVNTSGDVGRLRYYQDGGCIICRTPSPTTRGAVSRVPGLYIASFTCADRYNNSANNSIYLLNLLSSDPKQDTDITIKSPVIKPDLPEDPCNIAPDGNVTPTDQDPTEPTPDPTGGTPPDWDLDTDVEPDGDGGFKIPFTLPDLDIDWSISGLQNKFPFSIPFDIYNLCSILNATPQAPHFTGELDLKLYTWEIDIDLSEFDGMARILRIMELIGFVIGLAFVTRYMIKG